MKTKLQRITVPFEFKQFSEFWVFEKDSVSKKQAKDSQNPVSHRDFRETISYFEKLGFVNVSQNEIVLSEAGEYALSDFKEEDEASQKDGWKMLSFTAFPKMSQLLDSAGKFTISFKNCIMAYTRNEEDLHFEDKKKDDNGKVLIFKTEAAALEFEKLERTFRLMKSDQTEWSRDCDVL